MHGWWKFKPKKLKYRIEAFSVGRHPVTPLYDRVNGLPSSIAGPFELAGL